MAFNASMNKWCYSFQQTGIQFRDLIFSIAYYYMQFMQRDVLLDLTVKNKKLVYGVNTVTQLSNIDNKVKYQ